MNTHTTLNFRGSSKLESGGILLAGMEERKNNNGTEELPRRTLQDVINTDYFATQKLIRMAFIPGFDSRQYDDDIKKAYAWLETQPDTISIFENPDIPDYAKSNRLTIMLYIELNNRVAQNKSLSSQPIAFELTSEAIKEDIDEIKNSAWYKKKGFSLTNQDLLSYDVFKRYWHMLNSRARFLK